ncbi:hypothetical protein LJB75_00430, partial [Bacteroidales bacterium OttesenSCG-928-L19]|nr:hypothetical protein [Bacteroidales bacterium OttesenSCG-928-L19]
MKRISIFFFVELMLVLYSQLSYAQQSTYGNFPYYQTFLSTTQPAEISKPGTSSGTNAATFTNYGLQLTPAQNEQFGAVFINDRKFNSINGIRIEFEYMIYGGTGADGFTVFFFDNAVTNPQLGAKGASIGYTYRRALFNGYSGYRVKGLTGAYLGIAFDAYGNFKSTRFQNDEIIAGIGKNKSGSSHVTLRGAAGLAYNSAGMEAGFVGYPVLITQSTLTGTGTGHEYVLLNASGDYYTYSYNPYYTGNFNLRGGASYTNASSSAYRKAIIELYPITGGGMYVTVKIKHGQTTTTVIDNYPYKTVTPYKETAITSLMGDNATEIDANAQPIISSMRPLPSAMPQFLKVGFAASTGMKNDYHVIKNLVITLPGSAEAYPDTVTTNINTPVVISPLQNDLGYTGNINSNQVGSSSLLNPTTFKFIPVQGGTRISDYEYLTNEGRWVYNPLTKNVTFTPKSTFIGQAKIQYSIKGGLAGNTNPYADEAYRSLPADIVVKVSPQIYAVPSTILCGNNGVVKLVLDSAVAAAATYIQWYRGTEMISGSTGQKTWIVNTPGSYRAMVVMGAGYTTNVITVSRNYSTPIEQPYIHSSDENYILCGTQGALSLKIHEDYYRPDEQTYLWYKDGNAMDNETNHELIVRGQGVYKLLVMENGCAAFSNTQNVVLVEYNFPSPILVANPPSEVICGEYGEVLLYVANAASYGNEAVYNWFKDGEMIYSGTKNMLFVREEGSYTVRIFENNCSVISLPKQISSSTSYTIDSAIIASVTGETLLCGDDGIVMLHLDGGNFSSNVTYTWYKDGTLYSAHPDYQKSLIQITEPGRYFLRVIDGNCSTSSNEIEVRVAQSDGLPVPDYRHLPGTGKVCADQGSAYLYIHNNSEYPNGIYAWIKDGELLKKSSEPWYTATSEGNYYALITVDSCSVLTNTISLTASSSEIDKPVITPTIGNDTICGGEGVVVLSIESSFDVSAITGYQWFKDGLPISGATNPIYIAQSEGMYRLQIMQANCSAISDRYEVKKNADNEVENTPLLVFEQGTAICNGGVTQIKVSNAELFPESTYL